MEVKIAILGPLENYPLSFVCHQHVVRSFDGDTVRELVKKYTRLQFVLVYSETTSLYVII